MAKINSILVGEAYQLHPQDAGGAELNVHLNPAEAAAVDARVRALVSAEKITLAGTLVRLLMGDEGGEGRAEPPPGHGCLRCPHQLVGQDRR